MDGTNEQWRRWELANEFEQLSAITADIVRWLDVTEKEERDDLVIAVSEALSNAMIHGNLEVSSHLRESSMGLYLDTARSRRKATPYSARQVCIDAWRTADVVRIQIEDEGPGFDPHRFEFDEGRASGRGLLLIRIAMDEVKFNPKGNQITMSKRLEPPPGPNEL